MADHGTLGLSGIHRPYNWEYADATARTSATGFIATDIGKLARQLSDNSLWMLTATTPTWVAVGGGGGSYTDEMAQDAVGGILTDSSEIDFNYDDGTPAITASIVAGSIDETKLDISVNASLDLADSSIQPGDNISTLTNDAGYITSALDEKSKVSSNDTTAGYINGKLVAGTNITLTENNDGGNETLTIAASPQIGYTSSIIGLFKIKITDNAPPIVSGSIEYDNATQTSSTNIYISHLTDNGIDVDILLSLIINNSVVVIQDKDNSTNYQIWQVNGNPTIIPNNYIQIPVTLNTSGGTGTTGFANNHDVFFAASNPNTDELVKISANDTTAGNLWAKLQSGTGITRTEVNDGGNEYIEIATDLSVFDTDDLAQGTTNKYDQTVALSNGAGINVTGTYPNFTIASTITQYANADVESYLTGLGDVTIDPSDRIIIKDATDGTLKDVSAQSIANLDQETIYPRVSIGDGINEINVSTSGIFFIASTSVTITDWKIWTVDGSNGTIQIDISKNGSPLITNLDLTAQALNSATGLSHTLVANDKLAFNVAANDGTTKIIFELTAVI